MLTVDGIGLAALRQLFAIYGLAVRYHEAGAALPGSYWGAPEAGLYSGALHVRGDTPVHSALHEGAHYVCMTPARRAALDTDAGGDDLEEAAVCYLQVLLAHHALNVPRARICRDMDAWGYSFRLGTAANWFERDAEDARAWLHAHELLHEDGRPNGRCRGAATAVAGLEKGTIQGP
ncbi:MAG: hypothetical protein AAF458_17250 [Pseudomonadota bacterium]